MHGYEDGDVRRYPHLFSKRTRNYFVHDINVPFLSSEKYVYKEFWRVHCTDYSYTEFLSELMPECGVNSASVRF